MQVQGSMLGDAGDRRSFAGGDEAVAGQCEIRVKPANAEAGSGLI